MDKMCETKRTKIIETTYTSWQGIINYSYNELKNTLNNAYWFLEGEDSNLMTFQLFSNPDKKEVEFVACNLGSDIFDCLKLNNENLISTGGYVIKDSKGKEITNPVLDVFKQDLANSIAEIYLSKGTFNRYALSKAKIINAIDKEIFVEYNYQKVVGFIFDEMGAPLKFFIDKFRNAGKKIEEYRLSEKSYLPDVNGFDPILNGALLKAIGVNTTIPIEKYTYSKEDLEYYQIKEKQVDWIYAINAEFCGFWNALVDTADGLTMLLPSIYQILTDRATFKQFLRLILDFIMMTPQELGDILTAYDFENSKGSIYRLSYQQCYEMSMILSLFLPTPKIGKAGKAVEAIGEISAWLANFSAKNELILLAYKMGLRIERTAGEWQLVLGKYTLLKGSKEKVLKMVEDIGEMSKFEGNQNLSNLEKQLDEAVIEENGITRKLTKAEKDEILEKFRYEGGTSKKLFAIWKINFKEGRYNCLNTAIATDATLAGRPASALPYTIQRRFRNGKWENYASFEKGAYPSILEKEFNAKFTNWSEDLSNLTKDLQPGKRGIIFGIKKGKNVGHYFNVINEKGVIKYLDGQIGKRAKLVYDYYQFLPTN
ncbi:hypothetical protein JI747_007140 [Chryseobacterium sp. RG1]|uniref:Tox-PL domain-containing protein n=1 Tax=Chryseobacterium tagetis TaxID=2801334 RepID=A0ABS8A2K1_9FLAO|nr:toxin glutamine deamidase domain-containing protein [Chryseobacterium tagetis]MCA6066946.1 hypothetical protein [Chryseobacterium tagetis]